MLIKLTDFPNFAIFLVFFIPGFVSIKIYDLLIPSEKRDFSKTVYELVGYSCLNYGLMSWLIILIFSYNFQKDHILLFYSSIFLVMFVMPVLWPILLLFLYRWKLISRRIIHPVQKPWDFVFGQRRLYWVIIHLKDNRRIAGKYGLKSFVSSYPADEQIYLEELWRIDKDNKFVEPIERSAGAIVSSSNMIGIEFFE